jgi:hypothetical protein
MKLKGATMAGDANGTERREVTLMELSEKVERAPEPYAGAQK